jgi:hypothetical protein
LKKNAGILDEDDEEKEKQDGDGQAGMVGETKDTTQKE